MRRLSYTIKIINPLLNRLRCSLFLELSLNADLQSWTPIFDFLKEAIFFVWWDSHFLAKRALGFCFQNPSESSGFHKTKNRSKSMPLVGEFLNNYSANWRLGHTRWLCNVCLQANPTIFGLLLHTIDSFAMQSDEMVRSNSQACLLFSNEMESS